MAQLLERVDTAEVLSALYKNVRMAADSISSILPHVENEQMMSDLTVELSCFEEYASRAAKELDAEGVTPKEETPLARAGAKVGTFFNTLVDSSPDHLAEMMIKGATMGVGDLCRQLHAADEGDVSPKAKALLEEVLRYEENVIEEMKAYLR